MKQALKVLSELVAEGVIDGFDRKRFAEICSSHGLPDPKKDEV